MSNTLFTPATLGKLQLKNRIVMAPLTRSRAIGNVPNELMEKYYAMRADAGLIITEGTSPSANGLGYARIPGLFNDAQVQGWRRVTDGVHAAGGKIFVQLMHTGRVSHPANLPAGTKLFAPSAIAAPGEMWTDSNGMQPHPVPCRNERSRHRSSHRRICRFGKTRDRCRIRRGRTSWRQRLPDRPVPQHRHRTSARTNGAAASRIAPALRWKWPRQLPPPSARTASVCASRPMAHSTERYPMPRWMRCICDWSRN